jgi:hypothetical protein
MQRIYKTGSSASSVHCDNDFFFKKQILDEYETNAVLNGISSLSDRLSIHLPLSYSIKKFYYRGYIYEEFSYTQMRLAPWIPSQHISSKVLHTLALDILNLQIGLLSKGLTFVDARLDNFWLFPVNPVLVDLSSIRKLTPRRFASFRHDFFNNFIIPLIAENSIGLSVSEFTKNSSLSTEVKLLRSAFLYLTFRPILAREFITVKLSQYTSSLVSKASKEFLTYFLEVLAESSNSPPDRTQISITCKSLLSATSSLHPAKNLNSIWTGYPSVHSDSYTNSKKSLVTEYISGFSPEMYIIDLGSNCTYLDSARRLISVDKDWVMLRSINSHYSIHSLSVVVADVSSCIIATNLRGSSILNLFGSAKIAICLALVHHVLITDGLDPEYFYHSLSLLFHNLLIEIPLASDPHVQILLIQKDEHINWSFEDLHLALIRKYFTIQNSWQIDSSRIVLSLESLLT